MEYVQPIRDQYVFNLKITDTKGFEKVNDKISFGYHHYKRNKDVAVIQEIFNHAAPSITKRYIGIRQEELDETLEGFKL